jgi:hypothetical protein
MHFNGELEQLKQGYPFLSAEIEVFSTRFDALGVQSYLMGLSAEQDGLAVFSSAMSFESYPLRNAYFELLERYVALANVNANKDISLPLQQDWVYSKTSGVAAHTDLFAAQQSAFLELGERDRILRYWFLQRQPKLLFKNPDWLPTDFLSQYEFSIYSFPASHGGNDVEVIGVFAFPLKQSLPFFFGFGAGRFRKQALEKAKREAFQRFGFLYGESIPVTLPEFATNAQFHQEYYLTGKGQTLVWQWLTGQSLLKNHCRIDVPEFSEADVNYLSLTPLSVEGKAHVVKATAENALSLTFGKGHPLITVLDGASQVLVHPIA